MDWGLISGVPPPAGGGGIIATAATAPLYFILRNGGVYSTSTRDYVTSTLPLALQVMNEEDLGLLELYSETPPHLNIDGSGNTKEMMRHKMISLFNIICYCFMYNKCIITVSNFICHP